MARSQEPDEGPFEIAVIGDITEQETEISDKLLAVPPGGECTLYFDSPGGSAYTAISLLTLIATRELRATGIVTGVTAVTHPSVILLAGAVSPGSGSVSGQTLSATATGQVGVEYTPVFRVVPRIAQEFSEPNGLVVALDCEEVIQV